MSTVTDRAVFMTPKDLEILLHIIYSL
jgi:hypothetical protein